MRNLGKRAMQSARTSFNFGDIRNMAKFKVDPGKILQVFHKDRLQTFIRQLILQRNLVLTKWKLEHKQC